MVIMVYLDAVTRLIGPNLSINPQLIPEVGVGPAHHQPPKPSGLPPITLDLAPALLDPVASGSRRC
jgi:hypothetical protein